MILWCWLFVGSRQRGSTYDGQHDEQYDLGDVVDDRWRTPETLWYGVEAVEELCFPGTLWPRDFVLCGLYGIFEWTKSDDALIDR
jgi:hypothetical protein